jgi:hypothetical protein
MKEQCILEIQETIDVQKFDDKKVDWKRILIYRAGNISIPAGEHSFDCIYSYSKDYRQVGDYTYWTQVTGRGSADYKFKAGCTYTIGVYGGEVDILEKKGGSPKSVAVVPETQYAGFRVGMDLANNFGFVYPLQIGAVIDSDALTTGIYYDIGFGMGGGINGNGLVNDMGLGLFAYTGISAEFFLPSLPVGIGIGGGIASTSYFLFSFAPYIRASIIPWKRMTNAKLYFEYYFPEALKYGELTSSSTTGGVTTETKKEINIVSNQFGIGLIWYLN